MLAFFSVIFGPDGKYQFERGSLHNPPPELRTAEAIKRYINHKTEGWFSADYGYLCLKRTDHNGNSILLPALYLTDGPTPTKRFSEYKSIFSKNDIETYLKAHIERNREQKIQSEREMTTLVHDLRHLSSAIYHSAEQAKIAFKSNARRDVTDSLNTIVATQTMLKSRIDYLDYASGVDRFENTEKIPVYRRTDKVVRCFRAAASDRGVKIELHGSSYRYTSGPNILDIVSYTLIDNAIKYSPANGNIEVTIYDRADRTYVSVQSIGPLLLDQELGKIFERGFRGSVASEVRPAGTGLGLAVAKEIIETFGGDITVEHKGEISSFNNINYKGIEFTFYVPSVEEDISGRMRSRKRNRWGAK